MAANSAISWCTHTYNPWIGCTKVGPECAKCYAEATAKRTGKAIWGPGGARVRTNTHKYVRAWDRKAAATGEVPIIFSASMADVFEDRAEVTAWRRDFCELAESSRNCDWLILTKRPELVTGMVPQNWLAAWPAHIWLGTSVGHPNTTGRIDDLLNVPASVRVLSVEPLLEEIDLGGYLKRRNPDGSPAVTFVIVGGETGAGARPMHIAWARRIREACLANGVIFHFKQHGDWIHESQVTEAHELPKEPRLHHWGDGTVSYGLSSSKAGHLLDGVEYREMPNPRGCRRPEKVTETPDRPDPDGDGPPPGGERAEAAEEAQGGQTDVPEPKLSENVGVSKQESQGNLRQQAVPPVTDRNRKCASRPSGPQTLPVQPSTKEFLTQVAKDFAALGVSGEPLTLMLLYIVAISRFLAEPLSAIIQGASSSGKSHMLAKLTELVPPEDVYQFDDFSPTSLAYVPAGSLRHKVVVSGELTRHPTPADHAKMRALREMLSSGKLSRTATRSSAGGATATRVEQQGPIAFFATTTKAELFDEDASRVLLVSTDASRENNERVLLDMARAAEGRQSGSDRAEILQRHHQLQRTLKRVRVEIPYATKIARHFPAVRAECRRAFANFMGVIRAVALLRHALQPGRVLVDGEVLTANEEDYVIARALAGDVITRQLGSGVSKATAAFAGFVKEKFGNKTFSAHDISSHPESPVTSRDKILEHARRLIEIGALEVVSPARGPQPTCWRITPGLNELEPTQWLPKKLG